MNTLQDPAGSRLAPTPGSEISLRWAPPDDWVGEYGDRMGKESAHGRIFDDGVIYVEWIFYRNGGRYYPRFVGRQQPDGSYRGVQKDGVGYGWWNSEENMLRRLRSGEYQCDTTLRKTDEGWALEEDSPNAKLTDGGPVSTDCK